jgi:2-polyprenyl-3-methyl-5-hydroxy-6-metoxy-1,4-benzoquinol methylase
VTTEVEVSGIEGSAPRVHNGVHRGEVLLEKDGFKVIACEACGFRHVTPLPTEAELAEVYRHDYYSLEKPLYLERAREDKLWWDRLHDGRMARVEELCESAGRRLLDVGSGPGLLLERAAARGWEVLGIEPSRQAAAHARSLGVEICEEFLDDDLAQELLTRETAGFDCIHAAEVLEHLPDARAMVRRMVGMLRPGGVLALSVPNDFNPIQDALVEVRDFQPWWVAPPHHLNYFDFDSLEGLLASEGLEPVRRETTFPIDLFLLMGEDYTTDDSLGRACHRRRMEMESALHESGRGGLLQDLYDSFAALGIGRHAIVYARRSTT